MKTPVMTLKEAVAAIAATEHGKFSVKAFNVFLVITIGLATSNNKSCQASSGIVTGATSVLLFLLSVLFLSFQLGEPTLARKMSPNARLRYCYLLKRIVEGAFEEQTSSPGSFLTTMPMLRL